MSSSTSSSSPPAPPRSPRATVSQPRPKRPARRRSRTLLRVLVVLLVLFGALEVFTRAYLYPNSVDFSRFATYPERARDLAHSPGVRVAMIGNSATEKGLDTAVLRDELKRRGVKASVDKFIADSSHVDEWYYMLKRYFFDPGNVPDVFVITDYQDRFEDGARIDIGRLAQFFTGPEDWDEVFEEDLETFDERVEFGISSVWATFAARDRLKSRLLDLVVPNYEDYAQYQNMEALRHNELLARDTGESSRRRVTHHALHRLIDAIQANGAEAIFVAFPTRPSGPRPPYRLRPTTVEIMRAGSSDLIDLRRVPGLERDSYADELHLATPRARALYSRELGKALTPKLRALKSSTRAAVRQPRSARRPLCPATRSRTRRPCLAAGAPHGRPRPARESLRGGLRRSPWSA